jgi:hypothetical protein
LKGNDEEYLDIYGNVTTKQLSDYIFDKNMNHKPKSERPKQTPITKTELSGDIILAHYPDKVKQEERKGYELIKQPRKFKRRLLRNGVAYQLKRHGEEYIQRVDEYVQSVLKRKSKSDR